LTYGGKRVGFKYRKEINPARGKVRTMDEIMDRIEFWEEKQSKLLSKGLSVSPIEKILNRLYNELLENETHNG